MSLFIAIFIFLGVTLILALGAGKRFTRVLHVCAGWIAAVLAIATGVGALVGWIGFHAAVPFSILGNMHFALDPVRGGFIIVAAGVYAATLTFVTTSTERYPSRRATLFLSLYTLLFAAMLGILVSGDVISFIFTWEIMSLALWGLISFRIRSIQRWKASLRTIAFSEAGVIAGLAGLLLLAAGAGSTQLSVIAARVMDIPPAIRWVGFLLTFYGFGVKTGIIPVNVWMNDGYVAAPPAVRALFSGATLNLGVFALWIIDGPIAIHTPWMGLIVLVTGAITALLGIIYALTSHDLDKVLAQSSIENLGIVVAALGAGFAFVALGHPLLGGIALVAGLYHMVNHSVYKTALFLGAGAIDRATGTHDLDRLGGLMHRMPLLATVFLLAALAIAALPPFGGFVSEWLLLESLLRVVQVAAVPVRVTFALSGAMLALTAGLALTCFVMVAGTALLGPARSREAREAGRGVRSASWPMLVLVVLSFGLGVLATGFIPLLGGLVKPLAGADPSAILVPTFFGTGAGLPAGLVGALDTIGAGVGRGLLPLRGLVVLHSGGMATPVVFAMSMGLAALVIGLLLALVWVLVHFGTRRRKVVWRRAWNGGLRVLRPEMNYTATGFAAPVRVLFDTLLRPTVNERASRQGAFTTGVVHRMRLVNISERFIQAPLVTWALAISRVLARMHHGRSSLYAGYIMGMLLVALLAAAAVLR